MTVQELIDELMKVENKEKKVVFYLEQDHKDGDLLDVVSAEEFDNDVTLYDY